MPEGPPSNDGRQITPGAVIMPDSVIPLMLMPNEETEGHDGARIVGSVSDVRRESDGWITGRVHTWHEWRHGDALEADCDDGNSVMVGDLMLFSRLRLRAVTIGRHPCWPQCGEVVE